MPPKNENGYPWLQWKIDESVVDDKIDQWLKDNYTPAWKLPDTVYITSARHCGKSAAMTEYLKNDIESIKEACEYVKKEKEKMDKRSMMHKLQKDMYVEIFPSMIRGFIVAFDYTHLRVGVRPENQPSYNNSLVWTDPDCVTIVKYTPPKPTYNYPKPRRVVNDPEAGVTVVLWDDGEKTIVRAAEGEQTDVYDAFCAAFCKRIYGTNSALKRELNKVLEIQEKK